MWCKECRQDVPALPSGDQQTLCCPRCGTAACADSHEPSGQPAVDDWMTDYDGWELDEQLHHIQRLLQTANDNGSDQSSSPNGCGAMRFDPPAASHRSDKPRKTAIGSRGAGFLTWLALALGTSSFVCGGILLAWSLVAGRQELWNIGLPVALVGQIALLVGLVLQIDRLWRDNREAAAKLDDVDEQIHELKTATTLLGVGQGPGSATFYTHFAGGAGPQLLLTDLKGQLDLLAMKIAEQ